MIQGEEEVQGRQFHPETSSASASPFTEAWKTPLPRTSIIFYASRMYDKPNKKDIEESQLHRFREAIPDFPPGKIEEGEEPDFVIQTPTRRIGIELMRLYHEPPPEGQPRQQVESLRRQVCEKAQQLYEQSCGKAPHVFVRFSNSTPVTDRRVLELARIIESTVRSFALRPGQDRELEFDGTNRDLLPNEIIKIRASRPMHEFKCIWQPSDAASIPKCSRTLLENAISKKERRLPDYRKRADEIWLLLVVGSSISSSFQTPDPNEIGPFRTGFKRIYYFQETGPRTIQFLRTNT